MDETSVPFNALPTARPAPRRGPMRTLVAATAAAALLGTAAVLSFASPNNAATVVTKGGGDEQGEVDEDTAREQFADWMKEHNKRYKNDDEMEERLDIWMENLRTITRHNSRHYSWKMGMNEFGDLTSEEFKEHYIGKVLINNDGDDDDDDDHDDDDDKKLLKTTKIVRKKRSELRLADLSGVEAPTSIDWVAKGAVSEVKNQGSCGSCWAFSTTGALEGLHYIKTGQLVSLSEQELMDCSKEEGNNSCEGGLMDYAFEFVEKHGICSEADYPYKEQDSPTCNDNKCQSQMKITGYLDVDHSEDALMKAISQQPVAVAIEADESSFQFYSSGVMDGRCGVQLDHGVLAVGYGSTDEGANYWKVKNSWGSTWGDNGYILLSRDVRQEGGQCGILLSASYPTA